MDMRKIQLPRVDFGSLSFKMALRRIHLLAVLVLVGLLAVWWLFGRGTPVTVTRATFGYAAEIVYATGAIEPERWAKVTTLVKGRIVERCRCEGKTVKTGDMLALLDDKEAQATLRELKARAEFDRKELERQTQLMTRNVTTSQAFERAESNLLRTQALIAVQIERIESYRMLAPMDGVVLREDGEVGEIVDSNVILYRIGLPRPLQVVAEVNEEDIPKVRIGQVVMLRTDAFADQPLPGTVREITPAGDPVIKTYRIRIALPDETPLRVGMSVEVNIVIRDKPGALLVPPAAVVDGAVFVADGGRAHRRKIFIGIRGTRAVEILDGVKEGEEIVAPAPSGLRDGARIRVTSGGK